MACSYLQTVEKGNNAKEPAEAKENNEGENNMVVWLSWKNSDCSNTWLFIYLENEKLIILIFLANYKESEYSYIETNTI